MGVSGYRMKKDVSWMVRWNSPISSAVINIDFKAENPDTQ